MCPLIYMRCTHTHTHTHIHTHTHTHTHTLSLSLSLTHTHTLTDVKDSEIWIIIDICQKVRVDEVCPKTQRTTRHGKTLR